MLWGPTRSPNPVSAPEKATRTAHSPSRLRRWMRRLAITGLLLAGLALLLDGPGGRWIIRAVLTNQLAKQGLVGEIEIGGRLHSGYSLRNASFTGSGPIRTIRFDELTIEYRLLELIDLKIDGLSGRNITLVLHPEAKVEEPEDEETESLKLNIPRDTIKTARELALPVALEFQNISVEIQRDGSPPLTARLAGLSHHAGDDAIRLTGLGSNALGEEGLPNQDIQLDWTEGGLALSRVTLLPRISVDHLQLDLSAGQSAKVTAVAKLGGASVRIEADETGSAQLTLADDALNLGEILKELPIDLDLGGTLNTLVLDLDDLLAPPDQWRGHLEIDATDLRSGNFTLKAFAAKGQINREGIELLTTLGEKETVTLKITSPLPSGEGESLLANHPIDLALDVLSLEELAGWLFLSLNDDPAKAWPALPSGSLDISGRLLFGEDGKVSQAAANWHTEALAYEGKDIPPLAGSAKLAGELAELEITLAKPGEGEAVTIAAKANLEAGTYEANVSVRLPDPAWVNTFIPGDSPLWKPSGPVEIDWEGSGSYKEMTHKGSATIGKLALASPHDSLTTINSTLAYGWPGQISLESLLVQNGDLKVNGAIDWQEGILTVQDLETSDKDGILMKLSGKAPLAESLRSLNDLLDEEQQFDLSFDAPGFRVTRLRNLLPAEIPAGYKASIVSKLRLTGSAAHPKLDGQLQIHDIQLPKPVGLPPESAELEFTTNNDVLGVRGTLADPGGEILKLDAELPLTIRDWATKPESIREAPFTAHAVSNNFDIPRLVKFVPQLAGAVGKIGIDVTAGGSASAPSLNGNIAVSIEHLPLPDTPFRKIENSKILARFEGRRFFLDPSPINVAGGKIILSGDANLEGKEPTFTVNLNADHALLWRDDAFSARANAKLALSGTPARAKLSGSVDIVESLFYKDIEIIPIGVPATSAPKPSLPKIDGPPGGGPLVPAPAPISDWTVDIQVRTADPILVRGNLATGSVAVNAKVGGTISSPRPSGSIELRDIKADLPFSTLTVKQGSIILRPDAPINPTLDIRGTSRISNRQVSLLLFGPLAKPVFTLSSDPPLPENEILSLIATGATTSDLKDTNTASMKAFQLMIEEIRRRVTKPGGNEAFNEIMKELQDIDLKVGENDPFTGRKFSSATLHLRDRYHLSAGFDSEGNTRTAIIYSLGFR